MQRRHATRPATNENGRLELAAVEFIRQLLGGQSAVRKYLASIVVRGLGGNRSRDSTQVQLKRSRRLSSTAQYRIRNFAPLSPNQAPMAGATWSIDSNTASRIAPRCVYAPERGVDDAVWRLEFLQADDVRLGFREPPQQNRQSTVDAVDIEGRDFHWVRTGTRRFEITVPGSAERHALIGRQWRICILKPRKVLYGTCMG